MDGTNIAVLSLIPQRSVAESGLTHRFAGVLSLRREFKPH